ncbi:MAG: flavodoxin domain-containing protein [[Clostridium] leptum]
MKDIVVLYSSRYGSTKRYAEAIAARLHCPALDTKRARALSDYETIIFGGGIYARRYPRRFLLTSISRNSGTNGFSSLQLGFLILQPLLPMLEKIFPKCGTNPIFHFRSGMVTAK